MRVLSINNCSYGSTGMIMLGIHETLQAEGEDSVVCWSRGRTARTQNEMKFGTDTGVRLHALGARLVDGVGRFSARATRTLVSKIEEYRPDIIHLHNVHGYCLNMDVLFEYLKRSELPVVWTLHSCWPFTGHCSYFTYAGCEQWRSQCSRCPQIHEFPKSLIIDNSSRNFEWKHDLFTSLEQLTLVTPSQWLANLTEQSFFGGYPIRVIKNGIDTDVFRPCGCATSTRAALGVSKNKKMLLSVASPWSKRKGLEDLAKLSELLDDSYGIVIVGLDKRQVQSLPSGIVGIECTDSTQQLAELYSAADLFVNPTHEDNYPTVNIEALACGTRVLTYDTGGSPECSLNGDDRIIVPEKTAEALARAIEEHFARRFKPAVNSKVKSIRECSTTYLQLYRDILKKRE